MIRKLQQKFVLISMVSLFLVLFAMLGIINTINFYQTDQKINDLLMVLTENKGTFKTDKENQTQFGGDLPPYDQNQIPLELPNDRKKIVLSEETPFETRYFTVRFNGSGETVQINTGHIAAIDSNKAEEYAKEAVEKGKTLAYTGNYKYQIAAYEDGVMVIFVDCSNRLHAVWSFLWSSVLVAFGGLVLVSILVSVLSKRAIQPVIESMEKQKQFITDAGHEIKTPLAIISANTEVLEMTGGESEWTRSIRNQVKRLGDLVQHLLALSRLEEQQTTLQKVDFCMSDAVGETAQPFATLAETKGKSLNLAIQPNITYHGDEAAIRQLTSILMDNAVKYATAEGTICLDLLQKGKTVCLTVQNPCVQQPDENLKKLFDRFYREDASRTRETGGYGIGLSIAKAIVEAHHGKIAAKRLEDGQLAFCVMLSH